jgi:heat shock protein HslJ/membrane-bound inhibitor of C-type lysozyme
MKSLMLCSSLVFLFTACSVQPVKKADSKDGGANAVLAGHVYNSTVYACGREELIATVSDRDELLLQRVTGSAVLKQAISASGARYTGKMNQDDIVFWSKGQNATLEENGAAVSCTESASLLPLTLSGNEPSWRVIFDTAVTNVRMNFGQQVASLPPVQMKQEQGQWLYTTTDGKQTLTAQLENALCEDSMSGMTYPMKAIVTIDQKTYQGCAGNPFQVLSGDAWKVKQIDGAAAVGEVTLAFDDATKFSGNSGCNNYSGQYNLTGEGLKFNRAATTRMACAPALMQQEAHYLSLLTKVQRFEIAKDGALVLHGENDKTIRAERQAVLSPYKRNK